MDAEPEILRCADRMCATPLSAEAVMIGVCPKCGTMVKDVPSTDLECRAAKGLKTELK